MSKEIRKTSDIAPLGVRMQPELKSALVDVARKNGRSLNAEVVLRLEQSFQEPVPSVYSPGVSQPESAYAPRRAIPTQLQEMMLDIFDTLPVEKQLALISLFK
jgi:hypothetical protein